MAMIARPNPDGQNAPNGSLTCRVTALPLTLKLVVSFGEAGSIVGTEPIANRQGVTGNRLIAGLAGIFRRGGDVIG
jgi:hypothetical protein